MPQITVGPSAVPIPNNGTDPLYGINVGSTVLWYSKLPDVSPASGTPLSPGNAVQGWPAGQPLYIMSTGGNGSFAYEANGSQIAIGAVAASLLPGQSVAVSGGTIDTSGSQVGVSGTVGNVPQNNPTLLATSTNIWLAPMGSPANIQEFPTLNVAPYASVIINISDNSIISGGIGPLNMVDVIVQQFVNSVPVATHRAQWLLGGCNSLLQIPVVGTTMTITGRFIGAAAGTNTGTLTIQAVGSSEIIAAPIYVSYNPGARGTIPTGGYYAASTGVGSLTEQVNTKGGPADFALIPSTSTATGNGSIFACDFDSPGTPVQLYGFAPPTGGGATLQAILPFRPIQVLTRATAVGMLSSLTQ